jgi:hypothetical protein
MSLTRRGRGTLTLLLIVLVGGAAFFVSERNGWTELTALGAREAEDASGHTHEPGAAPHTHAPDGSPEPVASSAPPSKTDPDGAYDSAQEVRSALAERELPCLAVSPGPNYGSGVTESLRCGMDGDWVSILMFEDQEAQFEWLGSDDPKTEVISVAGKRFSVVVGPNWVIMDEDGLNRPLVKEIKKKLPKLS